MMIRACLLMLISCLMLALPAYAAQCDKNTSGKDLKNCKTFQTDRLGLDKIKELIKQGTPVPKEWRKNGELNHGGAGSVVRGDLESPFFPTAPNGNGNEQGIGTGGSPSFGGGLPTLETLKQWLEQMLGSSGGSQSPGPATQYPPDCSSYKHPSLLDPGELRGQRAPLNQAASNLCGATVPTAHDWAIFTRGASHAAITDTNANTLQIYAKSGNHLVYQSRIQLPKFFCELRTCSDDNPDPACSQRPAPRTNPNSRPSGGGASTASAGGGGVTAPAANARSGPRLYVVKTPLKLTKNYADIAGATRTIPIGASAQYGVIDIPFEDRYILITRKPGQGFKAPQPDPETFIAQGAVNVPEDCYSFENLFSSEIPKDFGDVMFGRHPSGDYDSATLRPQSYLAETDPGQCLPFIQYYNSYQSTAVVPPGASLDYGVIRSGNSYSRSTLKFNQGSMRNSASGNYYSGAYLTIPQANINLSGVAGGINQQQFPAGAFFVINNQRFLRINPPGRVRIFSDHRMQLVDGGVIDDHNSVRIRNIEPMGVVQFDRNKPITGAANHSMVPPEGSLLPTNAQNKALLPYDTRLDRICEQLFEAGIITQ